MKTRRDVVKWLSLLPGTIMITNQVDAAGRKLSKASQAKSLRELRADGATARDIRRMVGLGR